MTRIEELLCGAIIVIALWVIGSSARPRPMTRGEGWMLAAFISFAIWNIAAAVMLGLWAYR